MKKWPLAMSCVLMLLGACTRAENPCPDQMTLQGNRCAPPRKAVFSPVESTRPTEPAYDSPDADMTAPMGPPDGQVPDATSDAQAMDATARDAELGDAQRSELCSDEDGDRWVAFHASSRLVQLTNECIISTPACLSGTCDLDLCLRNRLGIAGCTSCIASEVSCVASYCRSACGLKSTDQACRACACESGCAEKFEACAHTSLSCDLPQPPEPTEPDSSVLSPELIMVIVGS